MIYIVTPSGRSGLEAVDHLCMGSELLLPGELTVLKTTNNSSVIMKTPEIFMIEGRVEREGRA